MGVPITKLNREHPDYILFKEAWSDFDILNAGGARLKQAAQQFLVKRPKELFDVYSERIRRVTYQNIIGTALGWYASALFKRNPQIQIKPADKWYEDTFLLNCDRHRTTFVDAFRDVFRSIFLYRTAYILCDLPHPEIQPQTRADEKELGLDDPYLVTYSPRDIINWANDEYGNLKWIVIKIQSESGDFLGNYEILTRWYYFDRTSFQIYEEKRARQEAGTNNLILYDPAGKEVTQEDTREADLIAEGDHALASENRVPVVRAEVPEEMWMANRVYLQLLDHFNQDNSYAWALFNSNLAMPVIYSDRELKSITVSEVAFLQLGEKDRFEWTEPNGHSFEFSEKRLQALREEVYRSLWLQAQGRSSAATPSAQSGYSKELDMTPSNDVLNRFGDVIRAAMQQTGENISIMHGQKATSWDVYGFKFETKPVTESVAVAQEMSDLGVFAASPTLEREAMKSVANDFLEDRNDEIKNTVENEIDTSPTSVERDAIQQQQQQQAFAKSFNRIQTRGEVQDEGSALAA